ncbi:hypothetical protein CR205_00325 [Alteribacter lacisalsi]|uniref:Uncharacterized protein n=2 Tax=Alteribacter lacisalsi TaxID=2045244 RepID=A0A2W0HJV9_9BACI|nr:hypothetical protein CR205_00325 [Alteribacter lacisalsi]
MKVKRRTALIKKREPVFLEDLFNEAFMQKYTEFQNFDDMVEASNICLLTAKAQSEIDKCPLWSRYVACHTDFTCWKEMKHFAATQYHSLSFPKFHAETH